MEDKKEKLRKGSYPAETLNDSLNMVRELVESRGESEFTAKDIAIVLGKSQGYLILKVSACVHYGLLEKTENGKYRVSELLQRIDAPVFEADKQDAILKALSSHPLYKAIIDRFNGKILPNETGLGNLFNREFHVNSNSIKNATKTFFENFSSHGLIDSNNRLKFLPPVIGSKPEKINSNESERDESDSYSSSSENGIVTDRIEKKVALGGNLYQQSFILTENKEVVFSYPKGKMTKKDFSIFRNYLKALEDATFDEEIKESEKEGT